MKAKQKLKPYTKITIVLETELEAEVLWHLLRCGGHTIFDVHADAYGLDYYSTKNHMLSALSHVFMPSREDEEDVSK